MPDDITSDDISQEASQAVGAVDSSSQHPEGTEPVAADEGTTAPPDPKGAPSTDSKKGPIPFARHEEILRNAREEAERQYGWAKELDPEEVRQARAIYQHLNSNPKEFFNWLQTVLKDQLAEPVPTDPNFRDPETGATFYSAERVQALLKQELTTLREELMREFGPIREHHQQESVRQQASSMIEEAKAWPHFDANIDAIAKAIETAKRGGNPISLERAYLQVVLPQLGQLERKSVLQEIKNKPGSDDVRPSHSPSPSKTPDADKSWGELLKEEAAARTTA